MAAPLALLRVLVAGPTGLAFRARRTWRRSLTLRVVAATVALSLITLTVAGTFLAREISDRLFESRRHQVLLEAQLGFIEAQKRLNGFVVGTPGEVRDQARTLLGTLEGLGPDRDRTVLLLKPPATDGATAIGDLYSNVLGGPTSVRADLRQRVRASDRPQYASIGVVDGRGVEPWLAVGQMVDVPIAGSYELYFLFDLSREQATLDAVQRVLGVGAAVLVLLVAAVAAVVARWVVEPVRQAAVVAERLSSGDLDQRMPERGEDDLARLARSFNGMAEGLQQQIRRLEELGTLQQRFVSDVSHELRTPLSTIRMAGEVLHDARDTFAPAAARSAELLTSQLDRFEALLADLLEISRYDAGAAALDPEPLDVTSLVMRVAEAAAPLAERRGSEVVISAPQGPSTAEVDRRRVERILRNLVVNAVEHGEGRPVRVEIAVDDDVLAVRVSDEGVGLTPREAARVFDRFWRADPARARSSGGTGLGLAISLEDAHLHGGRLQVSGRRGQGAHFLLTLPRRAGEVLGPSPLPLVAPRRSGRPALVAAPPTRALGSAGG